MSNYCDVILLNQLKHTSRYNLAFFHALFFYYFKVVVNEQSILFSALSNSSTTSETNCSSGDQLCQVVEGCELSQWTSLNGTFINSSETLALSDLKSGHFECNSVCLRDCVIRQRTVIHLCNTDSGQLNR